MSAGLRDAIKNLAQKTPGWATLVERIHEEAELEEEYDDCLIGLVLGEIIYAAMEEVWELRQSAERRRRIIEEYRRTKNAAAATAAHGA